MNVQRLLIITFWTLHIFRVQIEPLTNEALLHFI